LLNNDAVVSPSYFAEMRAALSRRPRAGLSTGTIYELANRSRVWYAGGRMLPLRALVTHELRVPAHEFPVQTEFVTGCAMVISRAAIEEVGMLAECYFPGYMEDAEYSWRIRSSGFELIYAPRAVVYHKVGTTFGARAVSTLTAYHQNRHRLYFVRRNLCGLSRITAMVYMIVTKPGRALIDLIQGRPDIGWAALRGTWAGLTTTPGDSARGSRESADLLRTRDNASR
jgi:GT2 family glycosyltransferase